MVRLLEGCVLSFSPNQVEREREHPIMRELQNDQSEIYPGELSLKNIFGHWVDRTHPEIGKALIPFSTSLVYRAWIRI